MLAITCDKCRRRFTPSDEEVQGYVQQAEGKRYALVLCPHCGKGNKVALVRLTQALSAVRRVPSAEEPASETPAAPGEQTASGEHAAPQEHAPTE